MSYIFVIVKETVFGEDYVLVYFNDSPAKMMKNAFYFILKALFLLKITKFLS